MLQKMFPVLAAGVGLGFPAHAQNFLPAPGEGVPAEASEASSEIPVPETDSAESIEAENLTEEPLEEVPLEEPVVTPVDPVPVVQQATSQENSSASVAQSGELLPGGSNGDFSREGWIFGIAANVGYDSNILQDEDDEQSDFLLNFAPTINFSSAPPGGAETIFEFSYSPIVRAYLENESQNAFDQLGGASLNYRGPIAQFSNILFLSQITQADRFADGRTQNRQISYVGKGEYQFSEKTSLAIGLGWGSFESDSFSLSDVDTTFASLTAYWAFTPLLRVGPSVRYAKTDSTNLGVTESTSFVLDMSYDATGLLDLSAFAGFESVDFSGIGGGESGPAFGIAADYQAPNRPWSLQAELTYQSVQQINSPTDRGGGNGEARVGASVSANYDLSEYTKLKLLARYGTFPSPDSVGLLINDFDVTLGLSHNFGSWILSGGVSYGLASYESVGPTSTTREDLTTGSLFLKHRTTAISDQLIWDNSVRLSTSAGDRDWNRVQLTSGLSIDF
ncbi:hypothetical protein GCM10007100_30750 [Roseibacillus persicicus]|uniref:Outer membrane protein beta-barrel domain-containing protein n=2 Tax=Roseibacillus persicicus TaxID=454148 RepID=A0A918TSR8_9BACT|nr:hypothetical protein GCM10007100_30750 [Roseibacillus persicicus]